ncbi:MAG: lysophospholipase [Crocinitomicaceae bacterium]|nr:lysophospholipase [Crocinitomicaceae bacterium]
MKKIIKRLLFLVIILYVGVCGYMYFQQESFIFHPEKINASTVLKFDQEFEELNITSNGERLNGALFKVKDAKGLVFFCHGNAGNIQKQADAAKFYTNLGFDFFSFDYRGYGKSTGEIESEEQFFSDVQAFYNELIKRYKESEINVIGYSLGTCPAAMLAAKNKPNKLILIAPYYSLSDMTIRRYKVIPPFLLKYKFDTYKFVQEVKIPILLVHGDKDGIIPFECSLQLKKELKKTDIFVPIKEQDHNNFEQNSTYFKAASAFLK